jgi:FKBP-type peptidyl-prolyl cis-trans isomerase
MGARIASFARTGQVDSGTRRTMLPRFHDGGVAMKTASGLEMETVKPGNGKEAKRGARVTVHYVGTLTTGAKFDSSRDRGEGFSFELGAGEVIRGWDEGVAGMKIGEVRKLTIPPELGYGARGYPPVIPANATLHFEVELLEVVA